MKGVQIETVPRDQHLVYEKRSVGETSLAADPHPCAAACVFPTTCFWTNRKDSVGSHDHGGQGGVATTRLSQALGHLRRLRGAAGDGLCRNFVMTRPRGAAGLIGDAFD